MYFLRLTIATLNHELKFEGTKQILTGFSPGRQQNSRIQHGVFYSKPELVLVYLSTSELPDRRFENI
jgi:hypothetical protein